MNLLKSTGKQSKKTVQQIAKQMAREPLEILKTAGSQVGGKEKSVSNNQTQPTSRTQSKGKHQQNGVPSEMELEMKSERLLRANREELDQIRKGKVYADIQKRISEGEEVPLENISELSMEQKQVLKAQMEAIKMRKAKQQEKQFVAPVGKQKRGILPGMKGKIQKMKRKTELRKGPSG